MRRENAAELRGEEMRAFAVASTAGDHKAAWRALERAHIISQPWFALHLASHWTMLLFALRQRDLGEVLGQCLRLALVPLGAVSGRLPVGNTGRSNVGAFRPMPIPPDLMARMNGGT